MKQSITLSENEITQHAEDFQLTREQIIEYVAEFKAYDKDGNGTITVTDLGVLNKAFGGNIAEDVFQDWVKKSDVDGDNHVTFTEFLKLKSAEEDAGMMDAMEKEIRKVFREMDTDGNGFLSADELKQGMMAKIEKKLQKMINEADVDGDGQINFLEFEKVNSKPGSKKPSAITAPIVAPPKPPDGGWGWVVVFSCFMCNFIIEGFGYTFGVLLKPFIEYFCSNQATVSWVGSLFSGVMSMFGPVIGGLVNKFGLRRICISGSIIACAGLLLSTLSPGVPILMVTIGAIGGLGAGAINLPANIAVGYYFETKRALATGISQCGSGVGQFVFAPLATEVLKKMDINSIVTSTEGLTTTTTISTTTITSVTTNATLEQCLIGNDIDGEGWKNYIYIISGLFLLCSFFGTLLLELKEEEVFDEDGKRTVKATTSSLMPSMFLKGGSKNQKEEKIIKPFSRNDLYYRGDVQKLVGEENASETWDEFRHLLLSSPSDVDKDNLEKEKSVMDTVRSMINFEILMKPTFLLFGTSGFISMLGFFVPLFFLPAMAEENGGLTKNEANFLLSIYAIANILGKLFNGWFSDVSWVNSFLVLNIYIFMSGISVILLPFCTSYGLYAFVISLYGFFTTFFILKTIVLVELLGLENLTSAFSLLAFFEGVAGIIGAPIVGAIKIAAGSYDIAFYVGGLFFIFASLTGFACQLLHKMQTKKSG